MQRIYKILGISLAILIVLFAGAPYFFGYAAKNYAFAFVKHENIMLRQVAGVQLALKDYKKGWFKSTATLLVQQESNQTLKTIQTIPLIIQHGPIYKAHREIRAGLGVVRSANTVADISAPYTLAFDEDIAFNGAHHLLLTAQALRTADFIPGVAFNSIELVGHGDVAASTFNLKLKGDGLRLKPAGQEIALTVPNFKLNTTATAEKNTHWKLVVGLNAMAPKLTYQGGLPSGVTAQAESIHLSGLHIDTLKMSSLFAGLTQASFQNQIAHHQRAGQWIHVLQQSVSQMVGNDTFIQLNGLSIKTPMGVIHAKYHVSFPLLPTPHDSYDVATHDVGAFSVDAPHLYLASKKNNMQMALSHFAFDSMSNTIFSRHAAMHFDAFTVNNIAQAKQKIDLNIGGFHYDGRLTGDSAILSQTLKLKLDKLCWLGSCFRDIDTHLGFLNLNATAFRSIATLIDQMFQENNAHPNARMVQGMQLLNAYLKLIDQKTQITFSNVMQTPKGPLNITAALAWPQFPAKPTMMTLFEQATYQLHVLFPADYLTVFLKKHVKENQSGSNNHFVAWVNYALKKGYLKHQGDAYVSDLKGKGAALMINGMPWVIPSKATLGLDQPKSQYKSTLAPKPAVKSQVKKKHMSEKAKSVKPHAPAKEIPSKK